MRNRNACICYSFLAGLKRTLDQIITELLKFSAAQFFHQVFRNPVHRCDVRKVNFSFVGTGKFNLRLFGCFLQALKRHWVFPEVNVLIVFEFVRQPVHDTSVEVVATEVHITVGGFHFEHTVTQFEDGDIKSTAAEIVHGDLHVFVFLIEAVSQCGCCRLIDDSLHIKTCDLSSFFCCLTFRVIEISRDSDNRFSHCGAEIVFCC